MILLSIITLYQPVRLLHIHEPVIPVRFPRWGTKFSKTGRSVNIDFWTCCSWMELKQIFSYAHHASPCFFLAVLSLSKAMMCDHKLQQGEPYYQMYPLYVAYRCLNWNWNFTPGLHFGRQSDGGMAIRIVFICHPVLCWIIGDISDGLFKCYYPFYLLFSWGNFFCLWTNRSEPSFDVSYINFGFKTKSRWKYSTSTKCSLAVSLTLLYVHVIKNK